MACRKGCGSTVANMQLLIKDVIRQLIDEGKLQEGLVDCEEKRLWRDARVVTCDILGDAVCQLFEDGSLCIDTVDAVTFDADAGKLCILFTNGNSICTTLPVVDTKLDGVDFDRNTQIVTFSVSDGESFKLDLSSLLSKDNIGNGLEVVGNKLGVAVDGTTIKVVDGRLVAQLPSVEHTATIALVDPFDENDVLGYAHSAEEVSNA